MGNNRHFARGIEWEIIDIIVAKKVHNYINRMMSYYSLGFVQ